MITVAFVAVCCCALGHRIVEWIFVGRSVDFYFLRLYWLIDLLPLNVWFVQRRGTLAVTFFVHAFTFKLRDRDNLVEDAIT